MMKQLKLTLLLIVLLCIGGAKTYAYDIAVENADGVTIYYNYINDAKELEVTYDNNTNWGSYGGNVVIPEEVTYMNRTRKVTSIGSSAFSSCYGLTTISIPNSVTYIGNEAFENCDGLTSITIPNSVTFIGEYAFYNCSGLTSITIPNSVTFIGLGAFFRCDNLTSVHISDLSAWCKIYFEGDIFSDPIYYHLFLNGIELKDLDIPNDVTSIGGGAFEGCSSLTSVTIPNSVTSIGSSAFYNCSSLTSVTIPNSVTSIGESALENCSSLASVTIGEKVADIGEKAFKGTTALKTLYVFNANPPMIEENTFDNSNYIWTNLYVPLGSKSIYMNIPSIVYWRFFKSITEFNPAGINIINAEDAIETTRFTIDGHKLQGNPSKKGVNIIKMSDGSTKKVLVK